MNNKRINFIEQPIHSLSPFSAHQVDVWGMRFTTVEHAYHYRRFVDCPEREEIRTAPSPLAAWKISQQMKQNSDLLDPDFDKDAVMEELFRAKLDQHEDVRKVLVNTGSVELVKRIETDSYWGTGKDDEGMNKMGKLWMKLREELKS